MIQTQPYEFGVLMNGGPEVIEVRSPKGLPNVPPKGDSRFMRWELRAIFEVGVNGHPWWFRNFYMVRLWWHRPKYHALAVRAFRAGRQARMKLPRS